MRRSSSLSFVALISSLAFLQLFVAWFAASAQSLSASLSEATPSDRFDFSSHDDCLFLTRVMCDGIRLDQAVSSSTESPRSTRPGTVHRLATGLLHDQEGLWVAPFKPSNLKWDALVLVGTGALIASDRQTSPTPSQSTKDLSANISNAAIYGTAATAGSIWIAGLMTDNPHQKETGLLTLEALTNAMPVYTILQVLAGRERPGDGAGHGRFWQRHSVDGSFPAGHAMFAWTMATVVAHEYPHWWVKVLMYGAASIVAAARFTDRDHFASDSALAAVLGYLIGRHIFHARCNPDFSEACR